MFGWTFQHVWDDLDYPLVLAIHAWLPNAHYRRHAMPARLAFAFESFAGAKHDDFAQFLPAWMRPDGARDDAPPIFTTAVITDVDLAFDLGFLSQAALVALGPKRLRAAGAFAPNRNTSTTLN